MNREATIAIMNLRAAEAPPILSTMDEVILYPEDTQLSFSVQQRDEDEERDDEGSFVVLDRTWFWFAIVFLLLIVLVRMTRTSTKVDEDGFTREKASLARMARWGHPISSNKKYHYPRSQHRRSRNPNTASTTTTTTTIKNPGIMLSDQGAWQLFKANTRIYTRSEQQQQQSLNSVRRAVSMRAMARNNTTTGGDIEEGVFLLDDNQAALQAPVTEVEQEDDDDDEDDVSTMLLAEQKSLVLGASCVCCAICFDSYKVGEQVTWIEPCCHQFHTHCLMKYTKTKWNQPQGFGGAGVACPLCRVPFLCRDEKTGEPKAGG